MRPRVIRIESKTVPEPGAEARLQRVVTRYEAIGVEADIPHVGIWTQRRTGKQTIHIARGSVDMDSSISNVGKLQHRGGTEALLDVEIPLLGVGGLEILRQCG